MSGISALITLQFIRYITTPFEKWKAFEMGLIDEDGKKIRDAETSDEKAEFVGWKNIIRKIKIVLEKVPGAKRLAKIASFATALWLIKEEIDLAGDDGLKVINSTINEQFEIDELLLESVESKVLPPGMYTAESQFIEDKVLFVVKEELQPEAIFLGQNMYVLTDVVSENTYTLAEHDIKELK